jgi:vancomycin resistance protein VanJ
VLGFFVLRWLIGEQWVVIAFFNNVIIWLLFLAIPTLILAIRMRSKVTIALTLPVVVLFMLNGGMRFLPRTTPTTNQPMLNLLSYNAFVRNASFSEILSIIQNSDADVVAIQEYNERLANFLEPALEDLYPYQATHFTNIGTQGQAVFSQYPILKDEFWVFDQPASQPLGNQRVVIDWQEQPFVLYNTHPTHPAMLGGFTVEYRGYEIDDLVRRTTAETLPLIWAGDFNLVEQSDDYAKITQHFTDSYAEVGWGLGFTFNFGLSIPLIRIDYVFHDESWQTIQAHVDESSGGSDHYPLHIQLARR